MLDSRSSGGNRGSTDVEIVLLWGVMTVTGEGLYS